MSLNYKPEVGNETFSFMCLLYILQLKVSLYTSKLTTPKQTYVNR